jgi:hypothetical protein
MSILQTLLDPKLQNAAAEDQAALKAIKGHRVADTPARANFLFGQSIEQQILKTIQSNDFTSNGVERLARLGEAYALQGNFEDAAIVAPNPAYQAAYEARARAMQSIGAQLCLCSPFVYKPSKTDAKGDRQSTRHKIEVVFNGKREITFYRCTECNSISAE